MRIEDHSFLKQQVAELLIVRASGHCYDSQRKYPQWELSNHELKRLLNLGVGGVIFFGGSTKELENRIRTIKSWSSKPLLLCADIEEGLGQRFEGGTWLVPPMALGDLHRKNSDEAIALALEYGRCTATQARKCGLNLVLAPVCDVNSNPANPVINLRAWGEDPFTVSQLVSAFHKGVASAGVLSCAKHFPGHGDTAIDSHLELPQLDCSRSRLNELELLPFQAVIAEGINSVMTAHLLVRSIDSKKPATLSFEIVTNLLRKELGFDGLVITDALVMKSISQTYGSGEAAVLAFEAGVDLIMMPNDADQAISAICEGLRSGRLSMNALDKALQRRRKELAKVKVSLQKQISKKCNFEDDHLEDHQAITFSRALVSRSLDIRHPGRLSATQLAINLVRIDGVFPSQVLTNCSPAISLPEKAGFRSVLCHDLGVSPWQANKKQPLALDRFGEGKFLVQLFLRGNPFRSGRGDFQEPWPIVIKQLQKLDRLAGLVVYGCPYLWKKLLGVLDSSVPAAYSPGQMPEAQKQILSALIKPQQKKEAMAAQNALDFTN